jgi:signal transduction histidine kinase
VEIQIRDNGTGISAEVKEKMFNLLHDETRRRRDRP